MGTRTASATKNALSQPKSWRGIVFRKSLITKENVRCGRRREYRGIRCLSQNETMSHRTGGQPPPSPAPSILQHCSGRKQVPRLREPFASEWFNFARDDRVLGMTEWDPAQGAGGWRYPDLLQGLDLLRHVSGANVVTLELAIESCPADAQHLAGERLVPFHLLEDALDCGAFDVLKVGG